MKKYILCLLLGAAVSVAAADQVTIQQGKRDFRRVTSETGKQQDWRRQTDPKAVGTSPMSLSIATPLQLPPQDWDVMGLRINIIYGQCVNFDGLDLGLVGRATGHANGLQAGAVNIVDGSSGSLQIAAVNVVQGDFVGMQIGVANYASSLPGSVAHGWQIGGFNGAGWMKGLQIGVINYAETMVGLQIGLINIIQNKDVAFMPIFNAAF